jgi:uncharacterized membrane protein YeiB
MWIGRQDVLNPSIRRSILFISVVLTGIAEWASAILTQQFKGEIRLLLDSLPMPPSPFNSLAAGGTAVVVILLCLEFVERFEEVRVIEPLAVAGQLSLTLYVAHVAIGMSFLECIGRLERQTLFFVIGSALTFSALGIGLAYIWREHFLPGPLEWVMRKISS